jgi:glycosyltransferase involved in cell wall biosynthesis
MSKVTVAIPTYNRDDYLRQAIASVLAETDIDLELLIVDTASPANVKEIVGSFNDARVNYFYHPMNLGMVGAANKCIELCQTEFLMVLSDDDRLLKDGLKKLYNKIVNNPEVAAVIGSVVAINDRSENTETITIASVDQLLDKATFYKQYLTGQIAVQPSAVLVRKSVLSEAGQYDPKIQYCPDMDLWLRVALKGKVFLVADTVGEYRIHDGTATAKFRKNAEIGRSYHDLIKKQYPLAKASGIFQNDELEELFRIAAGRHAGSCTAIGLECFKNGQGDLARQYFAIARQMTPAWTGKLYLSLLSLASFAGQSAYRYMQRLKRITKRKEIAKP